LGRTGADFFYLLGDYPAAVSGILAHGPALHGERLLILGGDASIEAGADRFGGLWTLAKNLSGFPDSRPLFYGHFTTLPAYGRRRSFSATRDSS
jgi:hypothetical protein